MTTHNVANDASLTFVTATYKLPLEQYTENATTSLKSEIMTNATGTVPVLIVKKAVEVGVDPILSLKIASCESSYNVRAKNKGSSAASIYQIISSTWESAMLRMGLATNTPRFSTTTEIDAGIFLLKEDGVGHWESSRNCWK